MMPVSYSVPGEKSSPRWAAAFAAGCGGLVTADLTRLRPGAFAAFCSPPVYPLLNQAQVEGRDWYYGDHGYFHRFRYYRITKNAYHHDGRGTAPPDRFRALQLNVHPAWNTGGSAIVVCPNSPVYMTQFAKMDAHAWVLDVVARLGRVSDRPVIVRWKSHATIRPLYLDLHDAWMVVVFSSASAIEALMAGVPVCTLAPWAATARMGITDLAQVESPIYPDLTERDQFLFNLAAQQWTLPEIRCGDAWRCLT